MRNYVQCYKNHFMYQRKTATQRTVINVEELEGIPLLRNLRKKKQIKSVTIDRTPEEWKKLIEEAKRKEFFWIKGIIPGIIDIVKVSTVEELEDD